MTGTVYIVLDKDVPTVWDSVAPLLSKALAKSQNDIVIDDVRASLVSRSMQLWVWVCDGAIMACCVTQILSYPRKKILSMPLIGGSDMKKWLDFETTMVKWAKEQGCSQMEGYCRDGWLRVLKNWNKVWTTMRRDI